MRPDDARLRMQEVPEVALRQADGDLVFELRNASTETFVLCQWVLLKEQGLV